MLLKVALFQVFMDKGELGMVALAQVALVALILASFQWKVQVSQAEDLVQATLAEVVIIDALAKDLILASLAQVL